MRPVLPNVEHNSVKTGEEQIRHESALRVDNFRKEPSARDANNLRVIWREKELHEKYERQRDGKIEQVEEPLRDSLASLGWRE